MTELNDHLPSDDDRLPDRLVTDLSRLYGRGVSVPPEVDDTILRSAREGFGRRRRFRLLLRWSGATVAAAAAVVLIALRLAGLGESTGPVANNTQPPQAAAPLRAEDADGNGRVDILDAFLVARRLRDGTTVEPRWDLNRDGTVDRGDVDRIAAAAVAVGPTRVGVPPAHGPALAISNPPGGSLQ